MKAVAPPKTSTPTARVRSTNVSTSSRAPSRRKKPQTAHPTQETPDRESPSQPAFAAGTSVEILPPVRPPSPWEGSPEGATHPLQHQAPSSPPSQKSSPPRIPEFPPVLLAGDFPGPELWDPPLAKRDDSGATLHAASPIPAAQSASTPPSRAIPAATPSIPLWLQARDPYCIVVFWNAAADVLDRFAEAQGGGGWRLQVTGGHLPDRRVLDDTLSTSLDHRFVAVPDPGCAYFAEIGFRTIDGSWISVSRSAALSTPVAGPSIPPRTPATPLPEDTAVGRALAVEPAVLPIPTPPARRRGKSRSQNQRDSEAPAAGITPPSAWDSAKSSDLLFALALEDDTSPAVVSSGEWVQRTLREQRESASKAGRTGSHPDSTAWVDRVSEGSSELHLQPEATIPSPGFWFEVNAELIVYGRTERDAKVSVGGRPIPLRPDGSFRFQFSLPDGEYEMPVVAVNARNDDGRAALLEFSRHSEYTGTVGLHPQDPSLNPPPTSDQ